MGDISPHDLHKVLRSWLLAEDPYGMRQAGGPSGRIEPTFAPVPASATAPAQTPATPAAPTTEQGNALRAANYGRGAVDRAVNYPQPPNVASEAFQGARDPRAQAQGTSAVDKALNPPPPRYNEGERNALYPSRASAAGESAVESATQPQPLPMNTPGWASPEESQAWASATGQSAVREALSGDTIRKKAKSRLQDPEDADTRSE